MKLKTMTRIENISVETVYNTTVVNLSITKKTLKELLNGAEVVVMTRDSNMKVNAKVKLSPVTKARARLLKKEDKDDK